MVILSPSHPLTNVAGHLHIIWTILSEPTAKPVTDFYSTIIGLNYDIHDNIVKGQW